MGVLVENYLYDNASVDATFIINGGLLTIEPKVIDPEMLVDASAEEPGHADRMIYTGDEEYKLSPIFVGRDFQPVGEEGAEVNIMDEQDYEIVKDKSTTEAVDADTYTITFNIKRNYTTADGTNQVTRDWKIIPRDISRPDPEDPDNPNKYISKYELAGELLRANGKPQTQEIEKAYMPDTYQVQVYNEETKQLEWKTKETTYEFTYDVEGNTETEPGVYKMKVSGNDNFNGDCYIS